MANDGQDPAPALVVEAMLIFDPSASDQFVFEGDPAYIDASGDLQWPQAGGQVNVSIILPATTSATFDPNNPMYLGPQAGSQCPTSYDPGGEFSNWSLSQDQKTLMFTDYNNDLATYVYAVNVVYNDQNYIDDPKIINQV